MLDRPLRQSPIAPTVDFSSKGTQHGFLRLPFSRDDSAWGSVMTPLRSYGTARGRLYSPAATMETNMRDRLRSPTCAFSES